MRLVHLHRFCQAEVRNLRIHLHIQQDVAGLEVPVNDLEYGVVVKIDEPSCYTNNDVESLHPIKGCPS